LGGQGILFPIICDGKSIIVLERRRIKSRLLNLTRRLVLDNEDDERLDWLILNSSSDKSLKTLSKLEWRW